MTASTTRQRVVKRKEGQRSPRFVRIEGSHGLVFHEDIGQREVMRYASVGQFVGVARQHNPIVRQSLHPSSEVQQRGP